MNKKLHILELIETIENRIIFDCNNDKIANSEYKNLLNNIKKLLK